MSERKRPRRLRVTLCAAITFDGKLDPSDPLPSTLLGALVPGDALLADAATARTLPARENFPLRIVSRTRLPDLSAVGEPPVRRWFCLGGPKLFRALLDAGLVDELRLLVRPRVDGRRGADTLSGPPTPEWFPHSISCRLRRMEVHGGDCFLHYTVGPRTPRRSA